MGEKEEGENKEEVKEAEKKEEEPSEIVLKVDMHCEGCARKVEKSLRKCDGVEEVKIESKLRRAVVKGKEVDPFKLCERVQKKTGRKAEVLSPLPEPPPPEEEQKKEAAPLEENKQEPKPITVVLKIRMHCEACAQVLQKRIKKMEGVESVVTDLWNEQVIVKGFIDPENLVDFIYRRTRRRASIVIDEKEEEEPEKNEEEKKEGDEGEKGTNDDAKKMEYWPPKYYLEYVNYANYAYPPPQVFSDENPNACYVM
ncbi:heavy metal-associated isoprenylated plant protein 7-like isoform X2 [Asparagus officinalis]|uniref:heavy metal-associated isoprenylated plant protein 7-like isoform X2 n=1 Tax=Asparagus officinalis TaxID=4686 RepID=UPI00098E6A6E|nr:heavy metal-associated isoprenylated plant protein 7-like isoform X2 [Asparagus officinalis]